MYFSLDPVKIVNTTPTKSVFSLAVNPHNDYHLVSHIDNQITIWDTRYFEKPVLTLSHVFKYASVNTLENTDNELPQRTEDLILKLLLILLKSYKLIMVKYLVGCLKKKRYRVQ